MLKPPAAPWAEAWPPPLLHQSQRWPQELASSPHPSPWGSAQQVQGTLLLELLGAGGTCCPHTDLISVTTRLVSAMCIYTHITNPPPPLINKSPTAGPRPSECTIGCLAGPAGCRPTPLALSPAHQRGPLSLFAICCFLFGSHVARLARDRARGPHRDQDPHDPPTSHPTSPPPTIWVKLLNSRDPLTVPGLLMTLSPRPAP